MKNYFNKYKRVKHSFTPAEVIAIKFISFIVFLCLVYIGTIWSMGSDNKMLTPTDGGAYTEALIGKELFINPIFSDYSNVDKDLVRLIFSGLLKFDTETQTFISDLAELTIKENNRIFELKLKENIFFHDGEPITNRDVLFTYKDIIKNSEFKNKLLHETFMNVEIVEEGGNIVFKLEKPNTFFTANLTIGILPFHILKDVPLAELEKHKFNYKPIGSGPYKVKQRSNDKVHLEINNKFHGDSLKIEEIKFNIYPNEDSLIKDNSGINVVPKITGEFYEMFKSLEKFEFIPYKLPQYTALFINHKNKYLEDKNLRLAISRAIDKTKLVSLLSHIEIIDSPLLELVDKKYVHKYSLEEAKIFLKEAGWETKEFQDEKEYLVNEDSEILSFKLIYREFENSEYKNTQNKKLIEFIKTSLETIGIHIEANAYKISDLNDYIFKKDYDLLIYGQNLSYNYDTFPYWHSSQVGENSFNLSNYKSFNADALIESLRTTANTEFKQKLLIGLEEALINDIAAITLYTPVYYYATDSKLKGISLKGANSISDRFNNMLPWYIKEKKI